MTKFSIILLILVCLPRLRFLFYVLEDGSKMRSKDLVRHKIIRVDQRRVMSKRGRPQIWSLDRIVFG